MAVKYKLIDNKIGTGSPAAVPPAATKWLAATVYAAGAIVVNGGFAFSTVAGGTSGTGTIGPTPLNLTDNNVTWVLIGPTGIFNVSDAVATQELGYIALGKDETYGVGEFIYVKFTGTCNPGDFVLVDRYNQTAARVTAAAEIGNLGVCMGTQANGAYGWVMIRGVHDGANIVTAAAPGSLAGGSGVAGRANVTTTVANYTFDGAIIKTAAATNVGTVELFYPTCSGR